MWRSTVALSGGVGESRAFLASAGPRCQSSPLWHCGEKYDPLTSDVMVQGASARLDSWAATCRSLELPAAATGVAALGLPTSHSPSLVIYTFSNYNK